jgi:hypothetical protein
MIVENRIVRNFRCVLLATFGIMSVMLFIWCFDSTLAPYTMNSFFSRFSKLSEVLPFVKGELKGVTVSRR